MWRAGAVLVLVDLSTAGACRLGVPTVLGTTFGCWICGWGPCTYFTLETRIPHIEKLIWVFFLECLGRTSVLYYGDTDPILTIIWGLVTLIWGFRPHISVNMEIANMGFFLINMGLC